MESDKILADLVRKIEHRFYGKYRGLVVDNADPQKLGRLKVKVPGVLGKDVVTGWALPCVPYGGDSNQGLLCIPEINAGVWIEFEQGDLEFPIWVGTFWSRPEGRSELPKPNDAQGGQQEEIQSPATCKIFKTKKGHTIQIEDQDGHERVLIYEASHGHLISLNKEGIRIRDGANQQEWIMNQDGITVSDSTGNSIEMKKDVFRLVSKVPFKIEAAGQTVEITAHTIDLNKG